jgi:hypothetical protein
MVMTQTHRVLAQAAPVVTQSASLSIFGGGTGTLTGLDSGKNVGITAGGDFGLPYYFHSWHPALELRGSYPFDKGQVDSQKNILGGVKAGRKFRCFHLYGDVVFGRGQINYGKGYPDVEHDFLYLRSTSWVISPGAGVDFDISSRFSIKADAQFQRYSTPVTESAHLWAKPLTLGVVYRFNFNQHTR